ncbi:hypothetical protein [Hyphomicrobium sp. CS1BSMeth3]|uniref:hypothetical protein n=1 Tax=Hyphomicrobium sp. CS1BSMeth3 TaxID=1892844 RepID=UPI001160DF96|nr:hypothetical protein [Hyphomicrobium sp. CS1BSMeth3]
MNTKPKGLEPSNKLSNATALERVTSEHSPKEHATPPTRKPRSKSYWPFKSAADAEEFFAKGKKRGRD